MKKEKDTQEANERTTRSSAGVPKANNLKRAFRKLETAYEKPLKLYVNALKEAENVVHRTPSLCLQLTGSRVQDHVSWATFPKLESNCPVPECGHVSTMPLQSRDSINSGDEIAYAGLPKQMEEMVCLSLLRRRLGATVIVRTVLETSLESGAGGVSSW